MQNGLNSPGPFTIFLVFSAGLLTSLGPCSLSLLPVTIAYIGGTEKNKFKLISFSGGVVFSLVGLGAASGFLGKIYGQIPSYYTSFVALIAIIMGLNLLGILKFQFPNGPDIKIIEDKIPTFISANTCWAPKGITAHAIKARVIVIIGARIKITLFELAGIIISLKIYFRASARDCNKPNGPTTFGPCLF